MMSYLIILLALLALELIYFRIADHFNIIDKPNQRSSHKMIVLRGGGVIFTIAMWVWSIMYGFQYPWMLAGLTMVAGVSFVDDIHSLPNSFRLMAQTVALILLFQEIEILKLEMWWIVPIALFIGLMATNIYNFMDGINGITAGYSLAVLIPLALINGLGFIEPSYLNVAIMGVLVFAFFNFRPKGKAKCFAGDVGSIGIAFIILFAIGRLIVQTGDVTYLILLLLYGVDGSLTIIHRIMLHENLGQAHRKHAYQLMANELKIGHVEVSLLYMVLQLVVSLGFIYVCPNDVISHWAYCIGTIILFCVAYILFMKKYYHLHEAYLASLK